MKIGWAKSGTPPIPPTGITGNSVTIGCGMAITGIGCGIIAGTTGLGGGRIGWGIGSIIGQGTTGWASSITIGSGWVTTGATTGIAATKGSGTTGGTICGFGKQQQYKKRARPTTKAKLAKIMPTTPAESRWLRSTLSS